MSDMYFATSQLQQKNFFPKSWHLHKITKNCKFQFNTNAISIQYQRKNYIITKILNICHQNPPKSNQNDTKMSPMSETVTYQCNINTIPVKSWNPHNYISKYKLFFLIYNIYTTKLHKITDIWVQCKCYNISY